MSVTNKTLVRIFIKCPIVTPYYFRTPLPLWARAVPKEYVSCQYGIFDNNAESALRLPIIERIISEHHSPYRLVEFRDNTFRGNMVYSIIM